MLAVLRNVSSVLFIRGAATVQQLYQATYGYFVVLLCMGILMRKTLESRNFSGQLPSETSQDPWREVPWGQLLPLTTELLQRLHQLQRDMEVQLP